MSAGKQIMRQIYKVVKASLLTGKENEAYRAFDLLKLALGHGLGKPGEPSRLTTVVYMALKSNHPDIAGHGIDAFRPLLKTMAVAEIPGAVEQLGLIAVISLKQRYNFLAARAVEVIFTSLGVVQDAGANVAAMRALRLIGLTALRRGDTGLIREIQAKLAGLLAVAPLGSAAHEQAAWVFTAWLHRVIKSGDTTLFEVITNYIWQLADKKILTENALASLVTECSQLAGIISLNPYSQISDAISMFSLGLAAQSKRIDVWRQAVDGAGHAARMAVSQRTLSESFNVVYPLFETGRRMLAAEFNSGPLSDPFRQQALYILVRECLQVVEFVARKNFTTTIVDIIDQIYLDWMNCQTNAGQQKSIKKFCQLIFIYGMRLKRRQKRLTAEGSGFNSGSAMTDANREHLKQLGYLF
ncbi:hypothetical protein [Sporomusa carbonis]|uniref:hypothetical protein n=1 Tax=Sporomusa carbonis TaxID=3076075 RepID=UPI003C7D77D8